MASNIFSPPLFLVTFAVGMIAHAVAHGQSENATTIPTPSAKNASAPEDYFQSLQKEMKIEWPKNRRITIVAHGHSVPAGYFRTPQVRQYDAYPSLFHQLLCERFPTSVSNVIVTAIGGENSQQGAARFERDVLVLQPDLVMIDYALNDRRLPPEVAAESWRKMIQACQQKQILVILLTPTPDLSVDIQDPQSELASRAEIVRGLAAEFNVALVDAYAEFQQRNKIGAALEDFMSQGNHPNRRGHEIVSNLLIQLFQD